MYFDSHAHLDDPRFDSDRDAVLGRAAGAGVSDIVLAGVCAQRWPAIRDLSRRKVAGVRMHASYGLHPCFLDQHDDADLHELEVWLARETPVAIGECGLDFHDGSDPRRQQRYFLHQIGLARETGLPLIVHARKAVEAVLLTLRREGPVRGVVHSYGGSPEQARQFWDMGIRLGLGGPLTYPRSRRLRHLVGEIPLQQLLLESDAPDQTGAAHRGHRNEPAWLPEVAETVAGIRDLPVETVASTTRANALHLFAIDAD